MCPCLPAESAAETGNSTKVCKLNKIDLQNGGSKIIKSGLSTEVNNLITDAQRYMLTMASQKTYEYKELIYPENYNGNPVVDLTASPAGTYYLEGSKLLSLNDVTYRINGNQNIVFNFNFLRGELC